GKMVGLSLVVFCISGVLCGEWSSFMPQSVEVVKGSCVTIPCSFDIANGFDTNLNNECEAIWKNTANDPKLTTTKAMTGDLTKKDCTSTFDNITPDYSDQYFFRLECPNPLIMSFTGTRVRIVVTDVPPTPTLTQSPLEVKEGSSVSLTCSAPAPCWTHPPTLTWTPSLDSYFGTLISITISFKIKDAANFQNLWFDPPKAIRVSVSPSGPVQHNSDVTLTCTSDANPAVRSYTWYRVDGSLETVIGTGAVLKMKASEVSRPFLCEATNIVGTGRSNQNQVQCMYDTTKRCNVLKPQ
uniref:Ig-like domain-containing protein n=1 Tax=Stegastes partitus TaxID=144197 RepID=A0A3B4ZMT9_9TELE